MSVKTFMFRAVPLFRLILLQQYLMNSLNSFDKTDRKYSLVHTDDLIRFGMSEVKVEVRADLGMW